jgi:hypothetical protein
MHNRAHAKNSQFQKRSLACSGSRDGSPQSLGAAVRCRMQFTIPHVMDAGKTTVVSGISNAPAAQGMKLLSVCVFGMRASVR